MSRSRNDRVWGRHWQYTASKTRHGTQVYHIRRLKRASNARTRVLLARGDYDAVVAPPPLSWWLL